MTNTKGTPMNADIAAIARALSAPQRKALRRTADGELLASQSVRGTMSNFGAAILDWSFRPARLTPLGLAVRAHLLTQEQPR